MFQRLFITIAVASALTGTSGCFVNQDSSRINRLTSSFNSGIVLVRAIKNATTPSTVLDLVGDGSGQFGAFCPTTSACTCSFAYVSSAGASEVLDTPTSYVEGDLVRCDYSGVPSDVASTYVSLHVLASEQYSNNYLFNRNGGATGYDSSTIHAFSAIRRFQCKETVYVPYQLDSGIYDPFQSEDPALTYPMNFYTANMAESFARYVSAGIKDWNCPANPNDPALEPDKRIYSLSTGAVLPSGELLDRHIFPTTAGNFDRSSFLLARNPLGVFSVPVRAYIAPKVISNGSTPPIGYGARPISSGGVEVCPESSITIPTGYRWVKVWLFRASLDPKAYLAGNKVAEASSISCYPGRWPAPTVPDTTIPDCTGASVSINDPAFDPSTDLADRIISNLSATGGMCVNATNPAGCGGLGAGCTSTTALPDGVLYAPGSDIWQPRNGAAPFNCTLPGAANPLNLCTIPNQAVATNAPRDVALQAVTLPAKPDHMRYDFVYVVTPTSVMTSEMQAETTVGAYIPRRFRADADCPAHDPDDPDPADCDTNKWIIYGLKLHGVDVAEDPPGSDPSRTGDFPICAIQREP